ncbi:hypothetical protein Tco_0697323 [Tanacetum coccineum]
MPMMRFLRKVTWRLEVVGGGWHDRFMVSIEAFGIHGPLKDRAAKTLGYIDIMIDYLSHNAPLQVELLGVVRALDIQQTCFFTVKEFTVREATGYDTNFKLAFLVT